MNIRISLSDSDVRRALRRLRDAADDMSPAMQEVAGLLATSTENRFNTKRAPDGSAWAALSKATQARRLKQRKPANNPLVLSGRLKRSITTAYDRRSAVVGTDVPYASTHQEGATRGEFGSFSVVARTARGRSGQRRRGKAVLAGTGTRTQGRPIPWGDIPARPFLGFSSDDRNEIGDIIRRHLQRAID